jgi:hypothetical protein
MGSNPCGGGDEIKNTRQDCSNPNYNISTVFTGIFGSNFHTWPSPNFNYPTTVVVPNSQRFHKFDLGLNYFSLAQDITNCTSYFLEFDIAPTNSNNPLGGAYTFNIDFMNQVALNPTIVHTIPITVNLANSSTWQHVIVPFVYCPTTACQYIKLQLTGQSPFTFIDNVSLKVNNNPPPLTVNAGSNQTICLGTQVNLSAMVSNAFCTTSYLWMPGNFTTQNITVTPTTTTTYTLTVNDGCRSAQSTVTITVNNVCSGALTISAPTTYSSGITNWNQATVAVNADVTVTGAGTVLNITSNDVAILQGKRITIGSGATVNVSDAWLHSCMLNPCVGLWYGIEILAGGTLNVTNYSVIEDAQNAIITQVTGGMRPLFNVNGAVFNKNTVAIRAQQYTNGSAQLSNWSVKNAVVTCRNISGVIAGMLGNATNFNSFKSNIQTTTWNAPNTPYTQTTTLAGARSFAGVQANDNFFNIGNAGVAADLNVFDYLDYGMHLTNVTATIKNNNFINLYGRMITSPVYPIGVGIYAISNNANGCCGITAGATTNNHKNLFKDVFRAVHIENYLDVAVIGNNFTASQTLPTMVNGRTISDHAMYMADIRTNVTVNNNTMDNYATGVDFWRNLNYQVSANPVFNINFNTITRSGSGYFDYGIYAADAQQSTPALQNITINNNVITNVRTQGITTSYISNDLKVNNNDITILYQGSSSNPIDAYGIKTEYCNTIDIDNNCIRSNYTPTNYNSTANWNIRGVHVNSSTNVLVRCNNVYKVGRCFEFQGVCTSVATTNNGTVGFVGNTMNNARTGLFIGANGAQIGTQGASNQPMSNRWTNKATTNFWDRGNTYVETGSTAANSIIYCRQNISDAWPTNHQGTGIIYVNITDIISAPNGSEYTCGTNPCGSGQQMASQQSSQLNTTSAAPNAITLQNMLGNTTNYGNATNAVQFNTQHYVYDVLANNPALITQSTVLQNFYTTAQNNAIGKLHLASQKTAQQLYADAYTANNGFVPANAVEQNLQTANNIALNKLSNYNYVVTTQDISILQNIAAQCEMEGGKGVILARNILMQLSKGIIAFANNCNSNGRMADNTQPNKVTEESSFTLYPNPNDGNFTLNYTIALDAQLNITDVTGKIICSYSLLATNTTIEINCNELSNGVYLYSITNNNLLIYTDKLIIVK